MGDGGGVSYDPGPPMPVRATKRGAERTPIGGDFDVLICGASFAGLAVARELRATGARVLVLDRYEIGERQTSACAAPTEWLRNMGLEASIRQTFGSLLVHTPRASARWPLGWTFSTFDYRTLCELLWEQRGDGTEFETATVHGKAVSPSTTPAAEVRAAAPESAPASGAGPGGVTVRTDRGDVTAGLIVDALGWKRILGAQQVQPPQARLSRGLEVHPRGAGDDLELWIDKRVIRAGYGWSFPADDELRVGVGSFDPRDHVKEPTVRLVDELGLPPDGYQGNWIPHQIRPAVEDGVFFAGDSAGHCLPLTAEGIRTAFYFGIACGRELRTVLEGGRSRLEALERYAAFSASHRWKYECMLQAQHLVPRLRPRALGAVTRAFERGAVSHRAFRHYLRIAPPQFALPAPAGIVAPSATAAAA
jgi:menaquinone-9 beta-reductase